MPQQCPVMLSQLQTGSVSPACCSCVTEVVLPLAALAELGAALGPCLCAAVSPGSPEMSSAASALRYLAFPGIAFVGSVGKGEVVGPWEQQLPEEALAKEHVQGLTARSCSSLGSRVTDPFPAA